MKETKILNRIVGYLPCLVFIVLVLFMIAFRFPGEIELLAEDALYQKPGRIPSEIKIIAIDEITLAELGPYSDWNRSYFADLIEQLCANEDGKPKVIGMDVFFTGEGETESDERLAEAVKKAGNVVMASKLEMASVVGFSEEENRYVLRDEITDEIQAYPSLSRFSTPGFTNMIFDEDGYVRHAYTYLRQGDELYKSFSFQIAELVTENPDSLYEFPAVMEFAYTGNPGDFETIPMSAVLSGTIPEDYFADCIVLIGAYEEGLLDAYHVPVDHSKAMYGVECHANAICAFLQQKQIHSLPLWAEGLLAVLIIGGLGLVMKKSRLRNSLFVLFGILFFWPMAALIIFGLTRYKVTLLYIPLASILEFLLFLLIRYVELQKKRAEEMQKMLFSMADSMAEAIEGRTPYNANHTKNVAKRCIEMMDYINRMHKEKRTELHFTKQDKKQMYLAAMLHDIGKMDVPLEVMDKPTKLGNLETSLRARMEIIMLKLQVDALTGIRRKEDADSEIQKIRHFLEQLDGFNCGRPLKEEEWQFIDDMGEKVYRSQDGEEIPYLTEEERNDLHIKAGTLSEQERKIMQSHVIYTDKVLNHVYFGSDFQDVRRIAANHHELLNYKGYPNGIGGEQIDTMTRILTIMDIYDSLIADDRPYKKPKSVQVAFEILDEEAQAGKIDKELLEIAREIYYET
ncbi:MAG: CHASE2 domain-containing protein [Lachnospiraceae bacterium]